MKVATIEKILEIKPHPNADALELATILSWQVCVKKNEFKVGDLCVYIRIDSILDDKPPYEFLRNKNFRIKTVRLRGQVSQGIAFPFSLFKSLGHDTVIFIEPDIIGSDVNSYVYASHYEKPMSVQLAGTAKGLMPGFLKRTDEDNIKDNPNIIDELKGMPYYITVKVDGASGTFYVKNGEFGVCSRKLELKRDDNNTFWKIAKKYDLENKMKFLRTKNLCLQGEVYGPGINGNLLGEKEISLKIFNLFDIDKYEYLNYSDLSSICTILNIPMVSVIETGKSFDKTLVELQELANNLKYDNGNVAEGIVIRPLNECRSRTLNGRLSVKIMSEPFDIKYGN